MAELGAATLLIAGGGNIGSHLAGFLAGSGIARSIRVVDRDRVEPGNLGNQDFRRSEVGRPKAEVLAARLGRRFPRTVFDARVADLEDLPLSAFEVDLVLGGLDSRRARQALVSEIAWPLGVPVIDGGVGEELVGRVQVIVPGPTAACLECTWGKADYALLAEEYPCTPGGPVRAPPTAAGTLTGAVVAGLMCGEARRVLSGTPPDRSWEIHFDVLHRRMLRSRLRRAPTCRFDHEVVRERTSLPLGASVGDLLDAVGRRFGAAPPHLEFRRGLLPAGPFGSARVLSAEALRPRAAEPLSVLGLLPGERVRARGPGGSVWLAVDREAPRAAPGARAPGKRRVG